MFLLLLTVILETCEENYEPYHFFWLQLLPSCFVSLFVTFLVKPPSTFTKWRITSWKPLTTFAKRFILEVWQGFADISVTVIDLDSLL